MYIDRLRINNVRGFGEGQIDVSLDRGGGDFAGWTVFAGRNGAGKTSVLRALALCIVGPRAADRLGWSFSGWIHDGGEYANVDVEIAHGATDSFLRSTRIPERVPLTLLWSSEHNSIDPRPTSIESMGLGGPWAPSAAGWFLAAYGPMRRLTGKTIEAERMSGQPQRESNIATLFHDGATLIESLNWLAFQRLRAFEGRDPGGKLLTSIYRLLSDDLLPEPWCRVDHYDSDGLWVTTRGGRRLAIRDLSHGYQTVLALVLDLVRSLHQCYGHLPMIGTAVDLPGVVLIDEVDAHLHVSWQQRIGFWLKAHFPRIQFIVTSHSPFVCQAADKNGLILLPTPGTDEKARIADDELYYRAVNGPADAALLSDLFGLDHTWSDESERKRIKMAKLESRILHGRASDAEKADYDTLREQVPTDEFETVQVDRARRADTTEPPKDE